jgi:nicotinamidase-related amidase
MSETNGFASTPREVLAWTDIDLVKRHPSIQSRAKSMLVVIDMQERLMEVMRERFEIIRHAEMLLAAAGVLGVPIVMTEQYPKGLGRTDRRLARALEHATTFEKTSFSALGDEAFAGHLEKAAPVHINLIGIETHVCVAQTALDLKVRGYEVAVAADAVSSRRAIDKNLALKRLSAAGITITTAEAVIFEWLERAGTPEFKEILKIVK